MRIIYDRQDLPRLLYSSNVISLISHERSTLIRLRWPEVVAVPGCLDSVTDQVNLHCQKANKYGATDSNSASQLRFEYTVSLDHNQEASTDQ